MSPTAVLYPSFAMFALTLACLLYMGYARVTAIRRREIRIGWYRAYTEGLQPPRLHIIGRHVQNHFEVPPLFHLGILLAFVTQTAGTLPLVFGWGYVAARCVHSAIHLGSNNVNHRFMAFGLSLMMLAGLWGSVLLKLVRGA